MVLAAMVGPVVHTSWASMLMTTITSVVLMSQVHRSASIVAPVIRAVLPTAIAALAMSVWLKAVAAPQYVDQALICAPTPAPLSCSLDAALRPKLVVSLIQTAPRPTVLLESIQALKLMGITLEQHK